MGRQLRWTRGGQPIDFRARRWDARTLAISPQVLNDSAISEIASVSYGAGLRRGGPGPVLVWGVILFPENSVCTRTLACSIYAHDKCIRGDLLEHEIASAAIALQAGL